MIFILNVRMLRSLPACSRDLLPHLQRCSSEPSAPLIVYVSKAIVYLIYHMNNKYTIHLSWNTGSKIHIYVYFEIAILLLPKLAPCRSVTTWFFLGWFPLYSIITFSSVLLVVFLSYVFFIPSQILLFMIFYLTKSSFPSTVKSKKIHF
jgi:hypothetical protein